MLTILLSSFSSTIIPIHYYSQDLLAFKAASILFMSQIPTLDQFSASNLMM
jgi:hypothetical protein